MRKAMQKRDKVDAYTPAHTSRTPYCFKHAPQDRMYKRTCSGICTGRRGAVPGEVSFYHHGLAPHNTSHLKNQTNTIVPARAPNPVLLQIRLRLEQQAAPCCCCCHFQRQPYLAPPPPPPPCFYTHLAAPASTTASYLSIPAAHSSYHGRGTTRRWLREV